jgi:hypothetical protein
MDLRMLSPVDRLLVADAPGWRHDVGSDLKAPPVQEILAERRWEAELASRYAAVMSPYPGERSPVQSAQLTLDDPVSGAMAITVERDGGTDTILSSPDGETRAAGPVSMQGRLGFVSTGSDGKVERAYLLDGTALECGEASLALPRGQTVLKVASTEDRTFHLAEDLPTDSDWTGSYVLAEDTGFEIESTTARSITVRDYPVVACDEVRILSSASVG